MWIFKPAGNNGIKELIDTIEFIDTMALCLESGNNVQEAFFMSAVNVSSGNFRTQCFSVIHGCALGHSFGQALIHANPTGIAGEVFENLAISLKYGTKVSKILTEMSAQLRLSMIAKLEELAHEAPVKMIFPLVMFIFPVIFILLGTKAILSFMQSLSS